MYANKQQQQQQKQKIRELWERMQINKNIEIIDTPSSQNLWMNCDKARKYGINFSSVEDGLKRCANDYL